MSIDATSRRDFFLASWRLGDVNNLLELRRLFAWSLHSTYAASSLLRSRVMFHHHIRNAVAIALVFVLVGCVKKQPPIPKSIDPGIGVYLTSLPELAPLSVVAAKRKWRGRT